MRRVPDRGSTESSRRTSLRTVTWMATALGALACGSGNEAGETQALEDIDLVSYSGGYGGAPASAESTCSPADPEALTLESASRQLTFSLCHFDAPNSYTLRSGERAVTEGELESVRAALGRLSPGTAEWMCGADAGFLTLDVGADAGTAHYISSSSCPAELSAGRTPATGIGDLWLELQELSGE